MSSTTSPRQGKHRRGHVHANDEDHAFILQIKRSEVPNLVEKLNEALTKVGVEARLFPAKGIRWTPSEPNKATLAAFKRGEALLQKWVQNGTLIDRKRLLETWAVNNEQLQTAIQRRDLFAIPVNGQQYFPDEFLRFRLEDLSKINQALGDAYADRKLIFLIRKHGALDGRTAAEAVEQGRLDDVIRIANGWTHI